MSDESNSDAIRRADTPAGEVAPNPHEELVKVFDSEQESEAMVVNGLLQSAGIESDLTSLDAAQDILPGVGGNVILVRKEDADNARKVIQESKKVAVEDETAEVDLSDPKLLG